MHDWNKWLEPPLKATVKVWNYDCGLFLNAASTFDTVDEKAALVDQVSILLQLWSDAQD